MARFGGVKYWQLTFGSSNLRICAISNVANMHVVSNVCS